MRSGHLKDIFDAVIAVAPSRRSGRCHDRLQFGGFEVLGRQCQGDMSLTFEGVADVEQSEADHRTRLVVVECVPIRGLQAASRWPWLADVDEINLVHEVWSAKCCMC